MKNILFLILIIFTSFISYSQQVSLFNSEGKAKAYIDYGENATIFLWNGSAVAFLTKDENDIAVVGFNGKFLGWYQNGIIYNDTGFAVGAKEGATNLMTEVEPVKEVQEVVPVKPVIPIIPLRPHLRDTWSSKSLLYFLTSGKVNSMQSNPETKRLHRNSDTQGRYQTSDPSFQDFVYEPNNNLRLKIAQKEKELDQKIEKILKNNPEARKKLERKYPELMKKHWRRMNPEKYASRKRRARKKKLEKFSFGLKGGVNLTQSEFKPMGGVFLQKYYNESWSGVLELKYLSRRREERYETEKNEYLQMNFMAKNKLFGSFHLIYGLGTSVELDSGNSAVITIDLSAGIQYFLTKKLFLEGRVTSFIDLSEPTYMALLGFKF